MKLDGGHMSLEVTVSVSCIAINLVSKFVTVSRVGSGCSTSSFSKTFFASAIPSPVGTDVVPGGSNSIPHHKPHFRGDSW